MSTGLGKGRSCGRLALLLAAGLGVGFSCLAEEILSGVTRPHRDETLSALVSGRLETVLVEEGERVEPGQVLIQLYQRMEELEVARRKLIWESKAELESAQARVATAKADYESTKRVHETTQSFSVDEVNRKELEFKLALAEQKRLEIQEEREAIEYEFAQEQLLLRDIRAPSAGRITHLPLRPGETCQPHQPLARLVDTSQCLFVVNIDAALAYRLNEGQIVDLDIQKGPGSVRLPGTVSFISPVVDPASGLQEVKVRFDNPDEAISPGVSGTMILPDLGAP